MLHSLSNKYPGVIYKSIYSPPPTSYKSQYNLRPIGGFGNTLEKTVNLKQRPYYAIQQSLDINGCRYYVCQTKRHFSNYG